MKAKLNIQLPKPLTLAHIDEIVAKMPLSIREVMKTEPGFQLINRGQTVFTDKDGNTHQVQPKKIYTRPGFELYPIRKLLLKAFNAKKDSRRKVFRAIRRFYEHHEQMVAKHPKFFEKKHIPEPEKMKIYNALSKSDN